MYDDYKSKMDANYGAVSKPVDMKGFQEMDLNNWGKHRHFFMTFPEVMASFFHDDA
jgi:hypothetical protein